MQFVIIGEGIDSLCIPEAIIVDGEGVGAENDRNQKRTDEIDLEQLKWVVLMVLFYQVALKV